MSKRQKKSSAVPRTKAEWVSLAISSLLLAGLVAVIVALWISPSNGPARFRVERGTARAEGAHFYLPVTVINDGGTTGAQVTVEGKVASGAEETSATTFDFVPGHSRAEAVLIFTADPTAAEVRVVSFQQPSG